MKKTICFLFFLSIIAVVSAQTVENIRVEQQGENLLIHYRIGGSTSDQLYFVTLTCSIDGGTVFEPKSVIGDVGANIRGGKSFNTIVWDVFEDVEEVGNVEFFVKVDLTRDESQQAMNNLPASTQSVSKQAPGVKSRSIFIEYAGNTTRPIGVKAGFAKNWGIYGAFRFGFDYYYDVNYDYFDTYVEMTAGAVKKVVEKNKFRAFTYAGIGAGGANYYYDDYLDDSWDYDYTDTYFTFDVGAMASYGPIIVELGLALNGYYYADLNFGIGFIF